MDTALSRSTPEAQTLETIAYKDAAEPSHLDALLYLGIEHDDMYDQIKMNRMKDVLDFAYKFKDGLDVLRKVVIKAPRRDRVDRAWEYMQMRKEYTRRTEAVENIKGTAYEREIALKGLKANIEDYEK